MQPAVAVLPVLGPKARAHEGHALAHRTDHETARGARVYVDDIGFEAAQANEARRREMGVPGRIETPRATGDRIAGVGQGQRNRPADAATATGHQGDTTGERGLGRVGHDRISVQGQGGRTACLGRFVGQYGSRRAVGAPPGGRHRMNRNHALRVRELGR